MSKWGSRNSWWGPSEAARSCRALVLLGSWELAQLNLKMKLACQRVGVLWCPSEFQSPRIQASFLACNLRICTGPCVRMDLVLGLSSATAICMEKPDGVYLFLYFFVCLSISLSVWSPAFLSCTGHHKLKSWFFGGYLLFHMGCTETSVWSEITHDSFVYGFIFLLYKLPHKI